MGLTHDHTHRARSSMDPDAGRPTYDGTTVGVTAARMLALLRVMFGLTFLWAFADKTFGLGYATGSNDAWIDGGTPTFGFLQSADGPLESIYRDIAGDTWADWLFMIGLLGIGLALTLGVAMRIAAATGALMYVMMWTVVLPPVNNPVLDEHLLGAATLVCLALVGAGDTWGLGQPWSRMRFVARHPMLR